MSSFQGDVVRSVAPAPFSYAQAARGASTSASATSSKPTSGAITPAKEQNSVPSLKSELNGAKWSDSVEDEHTEPSISSTSTVVESASPASSKPSATSGSAGQVNGTIGTTSLASSTSTLVKDDVSSSRHETPSSVWEGKVQASQAARTENGRNRGSANRDSSRGRDRKKGGKRGEKKDRTDSEAAPTKVTYEPPVKLVDAPAPAVNPWAARVQPPKLVAVPKPSPPSNTVTTPPVDRKSNPVDSRKSSAPVAAAIPSPAAASPPNDVEKVQSHPSHEDTKQTKPVGKEQKAPKSAVDAMAWPKPEIVLAEEPKKQVEESADVESQSAHEAKGKLNWNKLDFTPSVVFNTPLPSPRRGGKGGARGAKGDGTGRSSVSGPTEKRTDSNGSASGGERRERTEATRSTSPSKRRSKEESFARRPSQQEITTKELAAKSSEATKSKAPDSAEQSLSTVSNALKSSSNFRKADVITVGGSSATMKDDVRDSEVAPSNGFASQIQEHEPVAALADEGSRTEVSSTNNERKTSPPAEFTPRNHERRSSGSYSTFPNRGRSERGRGAHRGGRNNGQAFQPNAHTFVNGQGQYGVPTYNNNPRSPTGFGQDPFVGQTMPYPQRYTGNRNHANRAASIPSEGVYRQANGYVPQGLQLNTGVQTNGMYSPEYYTMPATAVPYQNDPAAELLRAVTHQVEYYFSFENLLKDTFMRKHMDSQGFVLVSFIAEFKRLKAMTRDLELIKYVSQQSKDVEHWVGPDGVDRLRAAKTWDKWVMPKEDRDPSARHDGPESLHSPPTPHPKLPNEPHLMRHSSLPVPQSAGPVLGSQGFQSLNSFAAPYNFVPQAIASTGTPSSNHFQTSPTSLSSGQNMMPTPATSFGPSPAQVPSYTNGVEETEPDTFTDAEVETLKVVLRDVPGVDGSSRAASSRTFSNGSVEGLNGMAVTAQSPPAESIVDSSKPTSPSSSDRVNRFLASSSRVASPRSASRNGEPTTTSSTGLYYIKDKDSPSNQSPTDTTSELYLQARDRALTSRNYHPCPHDMVVMYSFWCHFLVRQFNSRMYMEFRSFAYEDASTRNEFKGLNSLLKYFGKALAFRDAPIRRSVAQDYVNLVRGEPRGSDRPAFKQLRAAWRDGALDMRNRKRIKDNLDPALEQELDR